jgi:hypothetical protein
MSLVHMTKTTKNHKEATKKRKTIPPSQIMELFYSHKPYNKLDPTQCAFPEDLVLYIVKGYHPFFLLKIVDKGVWF